MDLREVKIKKSDAVRHPWEVVRSEVIFSIIRKNFPDLLQKEIKVLDIGCGDTYLIEQLNQKLPAWKFFAADNAFSDEELKHFKKKYEGSSISVFNSLEQAGQNAGQADLVLLLDVIEHIKHDIDFLIYLKSLPFLEKSSFLITVPAFQSLFSSHDDLLGHYRRYTAESLDKTISLAGYKKLSSGYFFFSLLPARWLQIKIFFRRQPSSNKGVAGWNKGSMASFLFRNMLRADYLITSLFVKLRIRLPGLSTYIICKKPV